MSGYSTYDPTAARGGDAFDDAFRNQTKFQNDQYNVQAGRAVDAAIRGGVGDMMANGGSTYYQSPNAPPPPPPQLITPISTATPGGAPAPATLGSGAGSAAADTPANARVAAVENNGSAAMNEHGFAGKYSFGAPLLYDTGIFKTADGKPPSGNNWAGGTFTLPTHGTMTPQQFFADTAPGGAQDEAMNLTRGQQDKLIKSMGLDHYIGQTIGGVPITQDSLEYMLHFAGPGNAQRFLDTGGAAPWQDGNGISIPQEMARWSRSGSGGAMPQGAQPTMTAFSDTPASYGGMGGLGGMGGGPNPNFNARYDPILSRLAQTPGGGTTAMQILGQQSRYDMGMMKRGDTYSRLAMSALAHGDVGMATYYSQAAGVPIPPQILENDVLRTRFGQAGLMAERLYGQDRAGATAFTKAFMQSGDIVQALTAAGPPATQPHLSVVQLYDAATQTLRLYGIDLRTGQAQPIMAPPATAPQAAPAAAPGATIGTGAQPGQPAPPAAPAAAPQQLTASPKPSARTNTIETKVRLLDEAGVPHQQSIMMATGGTMPPAVAASVYKSIYNSIAANPPHTDDGTTPDIAALTEQVMVREWGPNWRGPTLGQPGQGTDMHPQPHPATSPAPAPAAAPAAATVAPVPASYPPGVPPGSQWSQSRQLFRDQQGNFYDRVGNKMPGV